MMLRMRAVVFEEYGPPEVLTAVDLPTPVPRGDQVLVRVHATTVTSAECGMRRGEPRWGRVIIGPRRARRVQRAERHARRVTRAERVFDYTVEDFTASG
jgi:NADPH:quinone reductase-like Zn-dependent oxidoreductase